MNTTLDRVNKVVLYVVPELDRAPEPADLFSGDLEVDSLSIVEIMTNIEKEFGVAFEDEEVVAVESVQDILDLIQRRH
ncbi:MAG: acyl carrier protein [Streptosporangiaceae bacterium]